MWGFFSSSVFLFDGSEPRPDWYSAGSYDSSQDLETGIAWSPDGGALFAAGKTGLRRLGVSDAGVGAGELLSASAPLEALPAVVADPLDGRLFLSSGLVLDPADGGVLATLPEWDQLMVSVPRRSVLM